jgi:hypothetical protein
MQQRATLIALLRDLGDGIGCAQHRNDFPFEKTLLLRGRVRQGIAMNLAGAPPRTFTLPKAGIWISRLERLHDAHDQASRGLTWWPSTMQIAYRRLSGGGVRESDTCRR